MMQALNIGWRPSFPFVTHEGSMLGYRCEIAFSPEIKIGWVILTNTTNFDFLRMNEYISRLIVPHYSKPAVHDMKKYTGIYRLPGSYDSLEISLKNDSLYSSYLKDALPETPLTPAGSNRFNGKQKGGYGIGYEFISDGKAGIKALVMGQLMWEKIR
jgi:hypothetical protein